MRYAMRCVILMDVLLVSISEFNMLEILLPESINAKHECVRAGGRAVADT